MQTRTKLSVNSQKMNEMFRRLVLIQLSGLPLFGVIPVLIFCYALYFIPDPTPRISYVIVLLSASELWDSVMTCLFIKPYRQVLL